MLQQISKMWSRKLKMGLKRNLRYLGLLAASGCAMFVGFFVLINVYIGILMATGINRGDIGDMLEVAQKDCSAYKNSEHSFTKHMHQIWNTPEVPDKFKDTVARCKKINPGYNYTLWLPHQRHAFIKKHYSWFLPTYEGYSQEIMRIDAVRYFILDHFGGIYFDIDIHCKSPFDIILANTTLETGVILGATVPSGCGNSWVIGKKRHPFLQFINKRLVTEDRWYVMPYMSVLLSTGPIFLWRTYLNYPCKEQVHLVDPVTHNNVYFNHLHHSSWHSWDGRIYIMFDEFYKRVLVHVVRNPVVAVLPMLCLLLCIVICKKRRILLSRLAGGMLLPVFKRQQQHAGSSSKKPMFAPTFPLKKL